LDCIYITNLPLHFLVSILQTLNLLVVDVALSQWG
jgi:hypothetical protein